MAATIFGSPQGILDLAHGNRRASVRHSALHAIELGDEDIQKIKVTVADMLANHADKPDKIYQAMEARFARDQGVDHFEGMLHYFDLSASVPKPIKDAVFLAQQIRNVWAHHAGRVDAHFLKYASHLGFQLGHKVTIGVEDTSKYITGIFMYGAIIANRWREKNGFAPITLENVPATTPLRDAFDSIYPPTPSDAPAGVENRTP